MVGSPIRADVEVLGFRAAGFNVGIATSVNDEFGEGEGDGDAEGVGRALGTGDGEGVGVGVETGLGDGVGFGDGAGTTGFLFGTLRRKFRVRRIMGFPERFSWTASPAS